MKQTDLEPGKYNVILGEQLASQLGVNRGDQIRVMVPSASQFTPMGRIPSQRLFNVIGTFAANSEVDGYEMLVNIEDASRLMRYPAGNITGWRLWLDEPLKVDSLSQQKLPEGSKWQDWRDRKGELFQAVRMEKNMMGLLLSLIVAVAAFNIITSLADGNGEAGRSSDPANARLNSATNHDGLYGARGQRRDYRCDPRSGAWRPACQPVK